MKNIPIIFFLLIVVVLAAKYGREPVQENCTGTICHVVSDDTN